MKKLQLMLSLAAVALAACSQPKPGAQELFVAVTKNDEAALKALIARGAEVNVTNSDGVTPLMLAAAKSPRALVSALLEARADPNSRDKQNMTPLMFAAWTGNHEAVNPLSTSGAQMDASIKVSMTEITAVKIAYCREKWDVVSELTKMGASDDRTPLNAFAPGNPLDQAISNQGRDEQRRKADCVMWLATRKDYDVDRIIERAATGQ